MAEPAYASAKPIRSDRRVAERRRSAAALLSAVMSCLASGRDSGAARERLEEEVRSIVRARSVAICDEPSGPLPPQVTGFEIPSLWTHHRARLEAVFESTRTLDAWSCQMLESAAQVAALLIEIERANGRSAAGRANGDGAAPLIGSSTAICGVRERIERVAATDFTVLIEGAIGPEPHSHFGEVFSQAAVG